MSIPFLGVYINQSIIIKNPNFVNYDSNMQGFKSLCSVVLRLEGVGG